MTDFSTGTINEATAAIVGTTMAHTIRDDVVAHAAWELVEEFTAGGGAVEWTVLKCLASESGLLTDFYVVMGRTLATGELRFAICEGYNSGTHTMSFFGHANSSGTVAYDSTGRNTATYVLGTAVFSGANNTPRYSSWVPGGISTKWWVTVDDDGFSVAFNGAANGFVHAGAYEPLSVLPMTFPIQLIGSSDTWGSITRNPAVASITAQGYALLIEGGGSQPGTGILLGFRGDSRYNDKLQGDQRPVAEQGINIVDAGTNARETTGWALGKQRRLRVGGSTAPAGIAFGDAYALDGNLWVPYLPSDTRVWDTGVAA